MSSMLRLRNDGQRHLVSSRYVFKMKNICIFVDSAFFNSGVRVTLRIFFFFFTKELSSFGNYYSKQSIFYIYICSHFSICSFNKDY